MRLISEDGRLDVPYEKVSLEIVKKDDPDGLNTYEVWAIEIGGGTSRWLMACYFSEEMALGAMQLICIGIIGEYVGRTFEQSKDRRTQ